MRLRDPTQTPHVQNAEPNSAAKGSEDILYHLSRAWSSLGSGSGPFSHRVTGGGGGVKDSKYSSTTKFSRAPFCEINFQPTETITTVWSCGAYGSRITALPQDRKCKFYSIVCMLGLI